MIRRGMPHDAQSFHDAWTSGDLSHASTEVGRLVRTAELLCRSAAAEPAEVFRSDLRTRLMTEAADVLVARPTSQVDAADVRVAPAAQTSPLRRRLAGLTVAAVTAAGSVGMISSSATAVPGDVLYPVKRGVESVQLIFHRGDVSRGEFQLDQARERLAEASSLEADGKDERIADALDAFSSQATEGSSRLFSAYDDRSGTSYADQSSTSAIATVNDFAAAATVTLVALDDDLPADAQAALDSASATVTALVSQASTLCTTCAPADISSLVAAVDTAARTTPEPPASQQPKADSPAPTSPQATSGTGSAGSTGGSQPLAPPTKVPSLKDITDPLIGGLLGDGDGNDKGLVPGLLGGLSGKK